jgi:predicted P-loop ATPase
LNNIPEITAEERNKLISSAMALNEWHVETTATEPIKGNGEGERPGDIYNNSPEASQEALNELLSAGWQQTNNPKHLVRPNKKAKDGISATFGYVAPGVLNVFSSNAHPFEEGHGYTPYQIRALLKHGGDFSLCSKELRVAGYYDKTTKTLTKETKEKILNEVKKNLKKGRYLSPLETNKLAEKLDAPVDKVVQYIQKSQEYLKDIEDYEDWPNIKKAEHFLKNNYKFRIDIISRLAEMQAKGGPWEAMNEHSIYRHLQHKETDLKFSLDNLKSLLKSDFVERYNPFVDYFEKLPKWDGKDHIKELCKYLTIEDSEYFETMFKKALVRQIKCALLPDYYNRIVIVFSSEKEEIGKSMFFMWLNPFGSKYYSDEVLTDKKDSRFALAENFTYSLEELDGLSKYGSSKLKATISTRGVSDRLPYAPSKEYFPRCCTFWGSTNQAEFLMNDKNTRWLPFKVEAIDWKGYSKNIDCKNLWEQAWRLYCDGYDCELTTEERAHRNKRNEAYRVEDIEESVIRKHFDHSDVSFMTNAEILAEIQNKAKGLKITWNTVTLGKTLARLGYAKKRQDNSRGWGISEKFYNEGETTEDLPF